MMDRAILLLQAMQDHAPVITCYCSNKFVQSVIQDKLKKDGIKCLDCFSIFDLNVFIIYEKGYYLSHWTEYYRTSVEPNCLPHEILEKDISILFQEIRDGNRKQS